MPDVEFYIIGPTDEDPEYFNECQQLVDSLGLNDVLTFTGRANVLEWYAKIHVVALTSISEGQPLSVMEANFVGIPCVASNVGSCEELLRGSSPDDIALGPSGLITPSADPNGTAEALITLLKNPDLRQKMGESGKQRIRTYYDEEDLNFAYLHLYRNYLAYSE